MTAKVNVRWAFNAHRWKPTEAQILAMSSYIQLEEKERISRFVFKSDAKASLIGRLMMRKFIHICTAIPCNEIKLGRDDYGKPYLLGAGDMPVNFNVSHQGDYVVLAGHSHKKIGVDVMTIEPPIDKNVSEFFRLMRRQFSPHEWSKIRSNETESQQLACFYRMWCLKESYVKNIGLGIRVPLESISFAIKSPVTVGQLVTDTKLYEKGVLKPDWVFEETQLDDMHVVAVSMEVKDDEDFMPEPYQFLLIEDLLKEAQPLYAADSAFTNDFMQKAIKPFESL